MRMGYGWRRALRVKTRVFFPLVGHNGLIPGAAGHDRQKRRAEEGDQSDAREIKFCVVSVRVAR
jgi:hypothetical protein